MNTTLNILWALLLLSALVAVGYGWHHQPTPQAKDDYMLKWLKTLGTIAPYILMTVPGIPPAVIPLIVHGIQVAETAGGSGPQKKAQVIDIVTTGLQAVNTATGSTEVDVTSAVAAVSSGIDATVNAVNAVHSVTKDLADDKAPTPAQPPTTQSFKV